MGDDHPPLELAGAHPHERDAVPVRRVHVRLDLEHEGGERRVERAGHTGDVVARRGVTGARSTTASSSRRTPKFVSAEPKNTGVTSPLRKRSDRRGRRPRRAATSSSTAAVPGRALLGRGLVERAHLLPRLGRAAGGAGEADVAARRIRSTTPRKSPAMPTGQVTGRRARSTAGASTWSSSSSGSRPGRSHLLMNVSSGRLRSRHTSNSLSVCGSMPLAASSTIIAGVGGRQHPVGVLGEVAVARGVEQVEHRVPVRELEHRRRDRDAALLLHLHPVGGDPAALAAGLHRAGRLHRPAVEEELLREGGLARRRGG